MAGGGFGAGPAGRLATRRAAGKPEISPASRGGIHECELTTSEPRPLPASRRTVIAADPGVRLEMPLHGEPRLAEVPRCTRTGVASKRPIGTPPGNGQKGGQHV